MRVGIVLVRMLAGVFGSVASASVATKTRRVVTLLLAVVALVIGIHVTSANNTQIAKNEKQIHQQYEREARQFAKAKPPKITPTCTTSVKSGTHTVRVDAKGRVSTSHTSGSTTKTCK